MGRWRRRIGKARHGAEPALDTPVDHGSGRPPADPDEAGTSERTPSHDVRLDRRRWRIRPSGFQVAAELRD